MRNHPALSRVLMNHRFTSSHPLLDGIENCLCDSHSTIRTAPYARAGVNRDQIPRPLSG